MSIPTTYAVCTLFEGDYHLGVAALANSLVAWGFKGTLYAGYRGPLPPWAASATPAAEAATLAVAPGVSLVFIPLSTEAHFTNHKADFMLSLLAGAARECEAIFYLDPDVLVNAPWRFLEEWVACGVALCEDVDSPVELHHPYRVAWRAFFAERGMELRPQTASYVNGGFVGVHRKDVEFLRIWSRMVALIAADLGGTNVASVPGGRKNSRGMGRADCFIHPDQSALNAAIESPANITASILNKQAMAFAPGTNILPHGYGTTKPWRRNYLREALAGRPPGETDRAFWFHIDAPLRPLSRPAVLAGRLTRHVAAMISRFYRKRGF